MDAGPVDVGSVDVGSVDAGPAEVALVVLLAVAAGAVNAVAGAGSLLTFPALLLVGLPPVAANATNTVGLVPGSTAAVVGYRDELRGARRPVLGLGALAAAGGAVGGLLLVVADPSVFRRLVPVLLLVAAALVLARPVLQRRRRSRSPRGAVGAVVAGTAVYGGYFGAAQGVVLVGALGALLRDPLQRVVALKNVCALGSNVGGAAVLLVLGDVRLPLALAVALGSSAGGLLGARAGRRLPEAPVRIGVAVVGAAVGAGLLLTG